MLGADVCRSALSTWGSCMMQLKHSRMSAPCLMRCGNNKLALMINHRRQAIRVEEWAKPHQGPMPVGARPPETETALNRADSVNEASRLVIPRPREWLWIARPGRYRRGSGD
jgi:hypothetical protein